MNRREFLLLVGSFLAGCAVPQSTSFTSTPTSKSASLVTPITTNTVASPFAPTLTETTAPSPTTAIRTSTPFSPVACSPMPLVAPTRPAIIPPLAGLDGNGLHVNSGAEMVEIDPLLYRLKVTGLVANPLVFSLDELRCMPRTSARVNLTCPGYFEDISTYSGVLLSYVLGLAGVRKEAIGIYLISTHGYSSYVKLDEALKDYNFLAYEWENEPVPVLHGFPVRAVIPSMPGSAWTKQLVEINVE